MGKREWATLVDSLKGQEGEQTLEANVESSERTESSEAGGGTNQASALAVVEPGRAEGSK